MYSIFWHYKFLASHTHFHMDIVVYLPSLSFFSQDIISFCASLSFNNTFYFYLIIQLILCFLTSFRCLENTKCWKSYGREMCGCIIINEPKVYRLSNIWKPIYILHWLLAPVCNIVSMSSYFSFTMLWLGIRHL